MPRRYLIAPDKFKGSLTSGESAAAIAEGIRSFDQDAELDLCPIADGGEGFMETLREILNGKWIECEAVDALGRKIDSRYYLAETPEGPTAVLEMSETAGLWRLGAEERNPVIATTAGVGMQIAHAVTQHRGSRIILGIGGSATNDGGCGMAAALGVLFYDENDLPIDPLPSKLCKVKRVDLNTRMVLPNITAACDVDNPLLGPRGATAVFSKQKGAGQDDQKVLEAALTHLVQVTGGDAAAITPGAGAAGGLGFGLLHFAGAGLVSGFDLLAGLLELEKRISMADHVITGEGSIDHQSLSGKGPVALARMANALGKPVSAFCGQADDEARNSGIFQSIHALADTGLPIETLIQDAAPLLTRLVAECAADLTKS